ncbi:polyprenol phosphomannose-dependent alpha 1,6 mannosyltransferase MptB [Dermacoccus nishinomiyaensis]|uniref:polyprenol phosphomannose-dependent alpha 1,6 mannosyltransferase MptB n=2 Tax=Bacteria TaxID=2 RepID=UPI0021A8571D|nr:polyprenol phosphomannose-dependent alpha 1,6 mannosyltransferase MptB [Dermacoccus nishinomiyaensis]MCT1604276.1 polyprenol phosphomannose-dependent alpha 1,6 mannosyltransferase MptB [Dermacoccus nishinomiyaensis]
MSTAFPRAERPAQALTTSKGLTARGVVGSALAMLGGFMTNDLPPGPVRDVLAPLHWLYQQQLGRVAGWIIVAAGMLLLAWAWVDLVRATRHTPRDGVAQRAATAVVRRLTALWALPWLIAPPMFSHDGWSYLAQGALTQSGRDPYVVSPGEMPELLTSMVDPIWRYTPTPYGPLPLTWGALCTEVVKEPTVLVWLQRVPIIIGLVLAAWAVPRLARRLDVSPALASALTLASPLMLAHGFGGEHNDVLLMGLVTVALVWAAAGRWVWATVFVGIAAGVKFTAIVAVVPVVLLSLPVGVDLRRRFARLAQAGLLGALVTALCGIPYGLGVGWIRALSVPGVVVTPASIPTALGYLPRYFFGFISDEAGDLAMSLIRGAGMGLAVILVIWAALRRPTGKLPSAMVTNAGVFAAVVLLAPVVHSWYAFTVLPCGVLLAMRTRRIHLVMTLGVASALTVMWDTTLAGASLLVAAVVVASHQFALTRRRDDLPPRVRRWLSA